MPDRFESTTGSSIVPPGASVDLLIGEVCKLHYKRVHALLEDLGLYRGQPRLLHALWEREGRTHSELAERLNVQPATITKMLQRMQEAGFVQRRQDSQDQRVSRVYLTTAGRDIQERVQQVWQQLEEEALVGLTPEERVLLRRFLTQVHDNLHRASQEQ